MTISYLLGLIHSRVRLLPLNLLDIDLELKRILAVILVRAHPVYFGGKMPSLLTPDYLTNHMTPTRAELIRNPKVLAKPPHTGRTPEFCTQSRLKNRFTHHFHLPFINVNHPTWVRFTALSPVPVRSRLLLLR